MGKVRKVIRPVELPAWGSSNGTVATCMAADPAAPKTLYMPHICGAGGPATYTAQLSGPLAGSPCPCGAAPLQLTAAKNNWGKEGLQEKMGSLLSLSLSPWQLPQTWLLTSCCSCWSREGGGPCLGPPTPEPGGGSRVASLPAGPLPSQLVTFPDQPCAGGLVASPRPGLVAV